MNESKQTKRLRYINSSSVQTHSHWLSWEAGAAEQRADHLTTLHELKTLIKKKKATRTLGVSIM